MAYYIKLYFLVLIPTFLAIGFNSYSNYKDGVKSIKKTHESRYLKQIQNYAEQFTQLERSYETLMINAILGIKSEIANKPISTEILHKLALKYNVSHLFIIDNNGNFTHSTNEHPDEIPNLFIFSKEYKKLMNIKNNKNFFVTPIIFPFPEKEPHKFITIWANNYFIEIGIRINEIAKNMMKKINKDENIVKVDLVTNEQVFSLKKGNSNENFFTKKEVIVVENDNYIQSNSHKSHYYNIEFRISEDSMISEITSLKKKRYRNLIVTCLLISLLMILVLTIIHSDIKNVTSGLIELQNNNDFTSNLKTGEQSEDTKNLTNAINRLLSQYREEKDKSVLMSTNKVTQQVIHDLKSPLTSLKYLFSKTIKCFHNQERLIAVNAIERIQDIINTLPQMNKGNMTMDEGINCINSLTKMIIEEKRIEFKSLNSRIKITFNSDITSSTPVTLSRVTFLRTMSNIINNSADALTYTTNPLITINMFRANNRLIIQVIDNGKGIPRKVLSYVKNYRFSYKKNNGSGIGLSFAEDEIKKVNGELAIDSIEGKGTTVTISIPIHHRISIPSIQSLTLKTKNLCIVDDDESIHSVWDDILANKKLKVVHLRSSNEFESWIASANKSDYSYLFDLELLGSKHNGL